MRILQLFADKPVSRLAIMSCFAVLMVLPWLHLLPADSALHLSAYWVTLIGKIMCLAMVALALDLVWGYAGILSLGHGLYFALGGYAMGMYLMRQASGNSLPEFMRFLSWDKMPWFWAGTDNFARAMILVVVTSPTYEGYISRLHCSVPLVVDAAHGAHLGLAPWLPGRMEGDAVICSYHKTLPALTQTAGVQVYDSSLAPKIKRYMDMYETSSPSYVLMNSVAKMADLVADPAAFETLQAGLQKLYKLPLQHLRLIRADDPTKINISTLHCNIDGNALAHRLRARGIEPEMSDRIHVICMATVGDTAAGFHLLARALTEIDRTLSPGDWPVAPLPLPPRHLQSWQVPAGEPLPYQRAVGRIACETVFAYPPGVPMIVPGEEITAAFVQAIQAAKNSGTVLHGTAGGGAERICCCVLTKE